MKRVRWLLSLASIVAVCCLFCAPANAFASPGSFWFESNNSAVPVGTEYDEDWDGQQVEPEGARFYYTGEPVKPSVFFWDSANCEIEKVTYANNVNPGTATVTVKWKQFDYAYDEYGNYIEYVIPEESVLTFKIEKESLNRDYFDFESGDSTYAYTGKAVKPKITSEYLINGVDYTVKYKNNVKTGTAQAVITGKGLFQGDVVLKYKIKRATKISPSRVYKGTKKISGKVYNVAKGDKIKLKIGGKTYSKTIKKAAKSVKFSFKVPKQTYGKKYTVTVYDKAKKKVASKKSTVWYSNKLKLGQTKKQVRLNPNWGSPSYVNKSRYYETWVYDEYDYEGNWCGASYLYFRGGRLDSWVL